MRLVVLLQNLVWLVYDLDDMEATIVFRLEYNYITWGLSDSDQTIEHCVPRF